MKAGDLTLGFAFFLMAVFLGVQWITAAERGDELHGDEPASAGTAEPIPQHPRDLSAHTRPTPPAPRRSARRVPDVLSAARKRIQPLLDNGRVSEARAYLMARAARANAEHDQRTLGYHLALLGELSVASRDLGAARILLDEAIVAFERSGDRMGLGYGYMQLGRMHIESRAIARQASDAYNLLLLARNQLHRYQYQDAESSLRKAIGSSLEISRYGTAANALETLAGLQRTTGRQWDADTSLLEAARLHAASGRKRHALAMLETLAVEGIDSTRILRGKQEVMEALEAFRISTEQVAQARDYRHLYHQYRHAGDESRAWEFRLKAGETLSRVSKRAMYHRQPDVVALLYESNHSMARAATLIRKASELFTSEGAEQLAHEAVGLSSRIF